MNTKLHVQCRTTVILVNILSCAFFLYTDSYTLCCVQETCLHVIKFSRFGLVGRLRFPLVGKGTFWEVGITYRKMKAAEMLLMGETPIWCSRRYVPH